MVSPFSPSRRLAAQAGSTIAFRSALVAAALAAAIVFPLSLSAAESGHSGGGGRGGSGHSGSPSGGGGCGDSGGCEDEGSEHSGGHKGKGGAGVEDKVFRGGQSGRGGRSGSGLEDRVFHGRGGGGEGGTRPAWAGGAVPEDVELGRLNMARSPAHVLDSALNEAYATNLDKNSDGAIDADASIADIESPMQNLALFKEAMTGARKVSGAWTLQDAAQFLGKAADKNIPITEDVVRAVGVIFGTDADLSTFAYERAAIHPQDLGVVFNNVGYSSTGASAFAQAADDARAVIKFHHDNPE